MFDQFKDKMKQMQLLQKLMRDENFKAFISHPKVRETLSDPEVRSVMKTGELAKISSNPKFAALMQDPEIAPLIAKINPTDLFR